LCYCIFCRQNRENRTYTHIDINIASLKVHPHVGGLASEELDEFTPAQENGKYLVLFDPLASFFCVSP
jgi:fructose-1,6-bisphosphatase